MASSSPVGQHGGQPDGVRITPSGAAPVRSLKHGRGRSERLAEPSPGSDGLVVSRISLEPSEGRKPLHYHRHAQNMYFALEGTLEVRLDGDVQQLGPGDAILVPAGRAHATRNPGATEITFLAIYDRSVADDFVSVADADPDGPQA